MEANEQKGISVVDINKEIPIALIGDWNTFNFLNLETNEFIYKKQEIISKKPYISVSTFIKNIFRKYRH